MTNNALLSESKSSITETIKSGHWLWRIHPEEIIRKIYENIGQKMLAAA